MHNIELGIVHVEAETLQVDIVIYWLVSMFISFLIAAQVTARPWVSYIKYPPETVEYHK